jgi:quercetin dioxygenase-like cupin family protein
MKNEGRDMDTVIIDLPPAHSDQRGSIQMLMDSPINSALVITSEKGSVRANHYHKKGDHHCYLASGQIEYHYRPAGSKDTPKVVKIEPGQMFYTPPMVEHAMKFLDDSVFYVFSNSDREQSNYEADVVRIQLV